MFTYEKAADLHRKSAEFYEAGKIACVLCHGVSLLAFAKLSNGEYLAKGKTVSGFANVEGNFAENAVWSMNLLSRDKHVTPWRIEDRMTQIGANYVQAGLWRGFAVRDENLITGQQNFSGTETAESLRRLESSVAAPLWGHSGLLPRQSNSPPTPLGRRKPTARKRRSDSILMRSLLLLWLSRALLAPRDSPGRSQCWCKRGHRSLNWRW